MAPLRIGLCRHSQGHANAPRVRQAGGREPVLLPLCQNEGLKSGFAHSVGGPRSISAIQNHWPYLGAGERVAIGARVLAGTEELTFGPGFEATRRLEIVARIYDVRARKQFTPAAEVPLARTHSVGNLQFGAGLQYGAHASERNTLIMTHNRKVGPYLQVRFEAGDGLGGPAGSHRGVPEIFLGFREFGREGRPDGIFRTQGPLLTALRAPKALKPPHTRGRTWENSRFRTSGCPRGRSIDG